MSRPKDKRDTAHRAADALAHVIVVLVAIGLFILFAHLTRK